MESIIDIIFNSNDMLYPHENQYLFLILYTPNEAADQSKNNPGVAKIEMHCYLLTPCFKGDL